MTAEPLAVLPGGDTDRAKERAPHRLGAAESTLGADGFEIVRSLCEQAARGLDPRGVDESRWRDSDFAREHAREVARAHGDPAGQILDREIRRRMIENERLQLAQWLALRYLNRELGAELCLAARPAQEHDELPRHRERHLTAEILFDQRQGEIDAGGDAGRGVDR